MKTDAEYRQIIAHARKVLRERKRKVLGLPKRAKGKMCRQVDRDEAAKAQRGYVEAGSYVRRDGTEVLKGADWRRRVEEVRERCGNKCEWVVDAGMSGEVIRVYACGAPMHDAHHEKKRWPRRNDQISNLIGICRHHHRLLDPRKVRFGENNAKKK